MITLPVVSNIQHFSSIKTNTATKWLGDLHNAGGQMQLICGQTEAETSNKEEVEVRSID